MPLVLPPARESSVLVPLFLHSWKTFFEERKRRVSCSVFGELFFWLSFGQLSSFFFPPGDFFIRSQNLRKCSDWIRRVCTAIFSFCRAQDVFFFQTTQSKPHHHIYLLCILLLILLFLLFLFPFLLLSDFFKDKIQNSFLFLLPGCSVPDTTKHLVFSCLDQPRKDFPPHLLLHFPLHLLPLLVFSSKRSLFPLSFTPQPSNLFHLPLHPTPW